MSQAVVLDDLEMRHEAFRTQYGHLYTQIEHCYNMAQFLHFILTFPGQIQHISLDHDLGDRTVDSHPMSQTLYGTGMDAVKLLIALPETYRPVTINVHSHNYQRQEVMVDTLRRNGFPQCTDIHFTDD